VPDWKNVKTGRDEVASFCVRRYAPVHAIASTEEINLGQPPNSRQTAAPQGGGLLHEDPLRVYALLRERIVQEDTLINLRMGWFLFFHAILLAFIGVIIAQNTIK
jgi:hypothetical protein